MENIKCALLNAVALYGTHRDIKFNIEQFPSVYWHKPVNDDKIKTIYIKLTLYETIEVINRVSMKGENITHKIYNLYGKNSSYPNRLQRYLSKHSHFIIPKMGSYYTAHIYLVQQINLRDYSIVSSKNKQKRARNWVRKLESRRIKKEAKALNQSFDFTVEACESVLCNGCDIEPVSVVLLEPETI
jgi:hypothetical protein